MIGRITGILIEKNPPTICIDTSGVGYEIDVPMTTFYDLPEVGGKVSLFTHLIVRDDAHALYGFTSSEQRSVFRILIKIGGIGARTALAILSGLTVDELAHAVAAQEARQLMTVPGIGKKTAERLLLELKGKLDSYVSSTLSTTSNKGNGDDIYQALAALGYSDAETRKAVKSLPKDIDTADGIRQALKALSS